MNASLLLRTVCQNVRAVIPKISSVDPLKNVINRDMHYMCNKSHLYDLPSIRVNAISSTFLQPFVPIYNLMCGYKMKTVLRRRCKHCLLMWINDRKYIKCKVNPRHNVVERKPKEYNTWILTHASQSKVREW